MKLWELFLVIKPIKTKRQLLEELIRMSTELDTKVSAVNDAANAISAAVASAVTLITQLRTDIANGSTDNPATLAQLDTIGNVLGTATTNLNNAVSPAPAPTA